jgi:predicted 3-demethylubiquinone-9 3-methyltransferase (glyoxalase superfamily)
MMTAAPFLMFQGGVAQAAMDLYVATFPNSRIMHTERYAEGEPGPVGTTRLQPSAFAAASSCVPTTRSDTISLSRRRVQLL